MNDISACDIGCDGYGYPIRPVRSEAVSGPDITPSMVEAGLRACLFSAETDAAPLVCAIYRAMRTARPLSEGPV